LLLQQVPVPNLDPNNTGAIITSGSILLVFIANIIIQYVGQRRPAAIAPGTDLVQNLIDTTKAKILAENTLATLKLDYDKLVKTMSVKEIVYIDDTIDDIELVRRLFRASGITNPVVTFNTAEQAYVYTHDHPVLFAMVDIKMLSNGFRFLDVMKSNPETRDVPIVFLSGSMPVEASMFQRGVMCFQEKPLDLVKLLNCLNLHGFSWSIRED
jgi:CheY-like chemotaxis protein